MEFITKIVDLNYDDFLKMTYPKDYNKIPVNIDHMPETDIGVVNEIFVDKDAPNNVYARIVINDSIYERIKDKITGCSVELYTSKDGNIIPTKCSILLGDEPVISDAGKTIIEKVYSKIDDMLNRRVGEYIDKIEYSKKLKEYSEKQKEMEIQIKEYSEKQKEIDKIIKEYSEKQKEIDKIIKEYSEKQKEMETKIEELKKEIEKYSKLNISSDDDKKVKRVNFDALIE